MDTTARKRAMEKFKNLHPGYFQQKNAEYYEAHREERKAYRKARYYSDPERERSNTRAYYKENREAILKKQKANETRKEYFKKYYRELKERVVAAYGGKCACCGECHFEFLTIDHINGGGRKDRAHRAGAGFYSWLEKHGFPKEGYRLLCMNCNFALGIYGHCPHQS